MADRSTYLENQDDQISAQKRLEQEGHGLSSALMTIAGIAAVVLAGRKVSLSKAFSSELKMIGKDAAAGLDRYAIAELSSTANPIARFRRNAEALLKPIPSGREQGLIARASWAVQTGRTEHLFMTREFDEAVARQNIIQTMFHGPISAVAPEAIINLPGRTLTSGTHGGLYARGSLFKLSKEGEVYEQITGLKSDVMGSSGSRLENIRLHGQDVGKWASQEDFYVKTVAPSRFDILREHKRDLLHNKLSAAGITPIGLNEPTSPDLLKKLSEQFNLEMESSGESASTLFKGNKGALEDAYKKSIDGLIKRNANSKYVSMLYKAHKAGNFLGAGPQFALGKKGVANQRFLKFMEAFKFGELDPLTGRRYTPRSLRYTEATKSLSGAWESGAKGQFYLHTKAGEAKREVLNLMEGTFFKQMEQTFGVGFSTAPNKATEILRNVMGSQPGSWGDFFARRYAGGFGRLALLGMGGFTAYKMIDYAARKATGGWGVTDVAGKMYTSAREFQQHVINNAGLVETAKKTEKAFPGLINSPAARLARLTAPYWATLAGSKVGGRSGAMVGLALGIATALLTWGDITQSPEELHKIYTGEQDVPIRKGRWWMFGKTPFGGGKIMYWRPHWYPMLRSKYKYKGQLWDSEEDELSTRGPLAPILSPILTGKLWDPYRWEKKHYQDRPYPMTGELFEPTMPFSWLLNATVGNIIKPQKTMHQDYWGVAQGETDINRNYIPGAASALGYPEQRRPGMIAKADPGGPSWLLGQGMYTLSEQMGIRGFLLNTINEQVTGRHDFLPEGPVVQTASRATGYERGYWDLNIGDPGETTEFFRRILPHRRRGIEEYNPIPNQMPDWVPGEGNYINFKTGDPYTKVEMGEARLPGAGYESLHRLHSGIPGVYDAVDRFMVLSDIAPYSKEYTHYAYLAKAMTRKDKFWNETVIRKDRQRSDMMKEFEFLSLTPPEDVTGIFRPLSAAYRKTIATLGPGGLGGLVEPFMGVPFVESPISKYFPYRTATQTYRDFRVLGSDFAAWEKPWEGYIKPYANKIASMFGNVVPGDEQRRREYEEYFDKLNYVKSKKLASMSSEAGRPDLQKRFNMLASKTMIGVDESGIPLKVKGSIPKRERSFFEQFSQATGSERTDVEELVSPQMARIYKAQWAQRDSGNRARTMSDAERAEETENFFGNHYMPTEDWAGWSPAVDMKDVQLKTVTNLGMDMHKFDLWETQERAMARRPGVPLIENIDQSNPTMDVDELRRELQSHLVSQGYSNSKVNLTRTASRSDTASIKIKVKRKSSKEERQNMREAIYA